MLNGYAVTTQFLIDSFKSNSLVNTIIFGAADNRDLNKADIFPLVHIMPGTFELVENRLEIVFDIAVVSIRQTPVTTQGDKVFGDNLIDNLNQSSAILAKELTRIELKANPYDIILESSTAAQPIIFADKNLLDGFECSITLSIQNSIEVCDGNNLFSENINHNGATCSNVNSNSIGLSFAQLYSLTTLMNII
jgi:hypothetical protein